MKAYVVVTSPHFMEDREVVGVFSSLALAKGSFPVEAWKEEVGEEGWWFGGAQVDGFWDDWGIREVEMDQVLERSS